MVRVERLSQIPFFHGLPAWALRRFAQVAVEKLLDRNDLIVRQHDQAQAVFFLISGRVQFLIRFEGVEDLLVGTSRNVGALIGWSVCRSPFRYTASVRCEEPCRVLKVPAGLFSEILSEDPRLGYIILKRVATVLAERFEQTRDLLVAQHDEARLGSLGQEDG